MFSQVIAGTRTAIIVGGLAAMLFTLVGTTIEIVSGYFGGWVDSLLMRIVDIFYAIPFIKNRRENSFFKRVKGKDQW